MQRCGMNAIQDVHLIQQLVVCLPAYPSRSNCYVQHPSMLRGLVRSGLDKTGTSCAVPDFGSLVVRASMMIRQPEGSCLLISSRVHAATEPTKKRQQPTNVGKVLGRHLASLLHSA